jgi:hypothetical protein
VPAVDLIREFGHAEHRPPSGVRVAVHTAGGITRPAIVVPVPSRVIWGLPLPRRATLRASLALEPVTSELTPFPVRFRVGISDDRVYEGLDAITIPPDRRGWADLRVDLSSYGGWKWSLFYRPDRVTWRLVLAVDGPADGPLLAVWGSPEIVTDVRGLNEYGGRRRELLQRDDSGSDGRSSSPGAVTGQCRAIGRDSPRLDCCALDAALGPRTDTMNPAPPRTNGTLAARPRSE